MNSYLGVALGAFNTMYLFPRVFLEQTDFIGEITTLLATATIISTFGHLGFPISLTTFLPKLKDEQKTQLMGLAIMGCLISSFILGLAALVIFQLKPDWMGSVGYLVLISLSMMIFEVFAAISQNDSRVIFPQFLKNTFRRIIILIALVIASLSDLDTELFYQCLGIGYLLQLLAVIIYSLPSIPSLSFNFQGLATAKIAKYGLLVMMASGAILVVTKTDILMIRSLLGETPAAFYNIAFFIGTVVAVPVKSIIVSIRPFVAKAWARDDLQEIGMLYKKSALTQMALTGFLFLLVWINLDLAFMILPEKFRFDGAGLVVFFIGLSEVVKGATGTNGMILTVSDKQIYNFYTGVLLIAFTIIGNLWLIPIMGLEGAALASLAALSLYNLIKLIMVQRFFKLLPFSREFWLVAIVIAIGLGLSTWWKGQLDQLLIELVIGNLLAVLLFGVLFRYTKALDDFKIFKFLKS